MSKMNESFPKKQNKNTKPTKISLLNGEMRISRGEQNIETFLEIVVKIQVKLNIKIAESVENVYQ